jgi:TetR/AcrR family transcriptional repressor of nem operon
MTRVTTSKLIPSISVPAAQKNLASQDLPRSLQAKARGETKMALIWCGTELLTERGFQITGIEEILSRVGVPKGSFYHYFKSKQDFGIAVIDNYVDFYDEKMTRIFEDHSIPPLARIQRFVDEGKEGMTRYEFKRGCLIGNMGQELASLNDEFRTRLESVLTAWEARLKVCLDLAVASTELPINTDTAALSNFFWIGWEGAILRAKLTCSTAPLDQFATMFFSLALNQNSNPTALSN